ncbi:acetylglutamate/acetylaminoadipate kinase [Natronomonas halophila]|uniref:acetylglutamate/acetylaminoadipate kinase n=1 Tax=Natronomonas halophila TaxID=2747817 RepID=UPI0015B4A065|nr:acetylglutamate/acetylaminoadipate kinase [Natronomonas halophila]QLD85758.1 acetylglutamate/acetylaminoadipate kinase [Natronomonas halophila]
MADTVVVKIGGARAVDPEGALADIGALKDEGTDVAVVHGGSTAVDDTLEQMGIDPEYVETPSGVVGRFTDEETMDVFKMAMAGLVNTDLVTGLQNQGIEAVGLSGVDGKLFYGPRKEAVRVVEDGKKKIRRGDHSGSIKQVNGDLLETLLDDGYTPVASPPMLGDNGEDADPRNVAVNTDADRASAAVAAELGGTLVSLTDVEGVYRDPDDSSTLIERVETPEEYAELKDAAEGFMGRKVMAATEALEGGASEVVVASANADQPIRSAVEGGGTHILPSALPKDD